MEYKHATSLIRKLAYQIKLCGMLIAGLLICNAVLGLGLWHQSNKEHIILVPSNLHSSASITNSSVSPSYLDAMALMLIQDRLNITPDSIGSTDKHFLTFVAPNYYSAFKKQLSDDEDSVVSGKISSAFYLSGMQTDPVKLRVEVNGGLKRWVGERMLDEDNKTYLLTFQRHADELQLTSFAEKVGDKN